MVLQPAFDSRSEIVDEKSPNLAALAQSVLLRCFLTLERAPESATNATSEYGVIELKFPFQLVDIAFID